MNYILFKKSTRKKWDWKCVIELELKTPSMGNLWFVVVTLSIRPKVAEVQPQIHLRNTESKEKKSPSRWRRPPYQASIDFIWSLGLTQIPLINPYERHGHDAFYNESFFGWLAAQEGQIRKWGSGGGGGGPSITRPRGYKVCGDSLKFRVGWFNIFLSIFYFINHCCWLSGVVNF